MVANTEILVVRTPGVWYWKREWSGKSLGAWIFRVAVLMLCVIELNTGMAHKLWRKSSRWLKASILGRCHRLSWYLVLSHQKGPALHLALPMPVSTFACLLKEMSFSVDASDAVFGTQELQLQNRPRSASDWSHWRMLQGGNGSRPNKQWTT